MVRRGLPLIKSKTFSFADKEGTVTWLNAEILNLQRYLLRSMRGEGAIKRKKRRCYRQLKRNAYKINRGTGNKYGVSRTYGMNVNIVWETSVDKPHISFLDNTVRQLRGHVAFVTVK